MDGVVLDIATKPETRAPLVAHEAIEVSARGLAGERSHPAARAVTLLARSGWDAACRDLGATLPWTLRRANLLVDGLALAGCVGARLRVGTALLEVTEDNPPCRVMDALHPGLRAALAPGARAGVACRVLEPGRVARGDAIRIAH